MPYATTLPFAVLIALALPLGAYAATDCSQANTTVDMEQCAQSQYTAADQALNQAYKALTRRVTQPAAKAKLITAQKAWIAYRDADCAAQYQLYEGGSMRNVVLLGCKRQRTEERTQALHDYLPQ